MKKTGLEVTTAAFAIILTFFRIPLKLFFIDPSTGFYLRENMLGIFFNCLFFLFVALCLFNTMRNIKDFDGKMRMGSTRCVLFSLSSVGIAVVSFLRVMTLKERQFGEANQVPKALVYPAFFLGIAAGFLLLFFAVSLFSGANLNRGCRLLSLLIPVWAAFFSISNFLDYRFTIYASDELMGSVFMISSILFFLYISRYLIIPQDGKKYLFPAAVTFMSGFSLSVPQLVSLLLLEENLSGPDTLECLLTFFISIIAFCFIIPPSKNLSKKNI